MLIWWIQTHCHFHMLCLLKFKVYINAIHDPFGNTNIVTDIILHYIIFMVLKHFNNNYNVLSQVHCFMYGNDDTLNAISYIFIELFIQFTINYAMAVYLVQCKWGTSWKGWGGLHGSLIRLRVVVSSVYPLCISVTFLNYTSNSAILFIPFNSLHIFILYFEKYMLS